MLATLDNLTQITPETLGNRNINALFSVFKLYISLIKNNCVQTFISFTKINLGLKLILIGGTIQLKMSYELEDQILRGNSTEKTEFETSTLKTVLSILPIGEQQQLL